MATTAIPSFRSRAGSVRALANAHSATRPLSADVMFVTSPMYLVQSMTSANANASAPAATNPSVGSVRPSRVSSSTKRRHSSTQATSARFSNRYAVSPPRRESTATANVETGRAVRMSNWRIDCERFV